MTEQIQDTGSKKKRRELCERFLMSDHEESKSIPTKEVILVREPRTDEDEISWGNCFQVLKKHWKVIFIPAVVIGLAVGIYTYTRPRFYQAQATLVPPIELMKGAGSLGSGLGGLKGSMLSSIMGETNLTDMYVGVLESRSLSEKIAEQFELTDVYEVDRVFQSLSILKSRTSFQVRDDGIISIQVTDLDPQRAADMANAFVQELDKENRRLSGGSVTSKRKFLETRLNELKEELSSIEQITSHESNIKEMIFEMLSQEYELARIEEAKSMPTIQILDEAIPPENGISRGTVKKTVVTAFAMCLTIMFLIYCIESIRKVQK